MASASSAQTCGLFACGNACRWHSSRTGRRSPCLPCTGSNAAYRASASGSMGPCSGCSVSVSALATWRMEALARWAGRWMRSDSRSASLFARRHHSLQPTERTVRGRHDESTGCVRPHRTWRHHPTGRPVWVTTRRGTQSAELEFDDQWIADPLHFAPGPSLAPDKGHFQTPEGHAMFAPLGDSAPDRWGRRLLVRAEVLRARAAATTPRTLRGIDSLLGVSDITRQGALRFITGREGPLLATNDQIPPDQATGLDGCCHGAGY